MRRHWSRLLLHRHSNFRRNAIKDLDAPVPADIQQLRREYRSTRLRISSQQIKQLCQAVRHVLPQGSSVTLFREPRAKVPVDVNPIADKLQVRLEIFDQSGSVFGIVVVLQVKAKMVQFC